MVVRTRRAGLVRAAASAVVVTLLLVGFVRAGTEVALADRLRDAMGSLSELAPLDPPEMQSVVTRLNESAAAGDPHSQALLAYLYEVGVGVQQNDVQALLHWHFAAMGGSPDAQMAMGFRHLYGLGVGRSSIAAAEYYLPVAEAVAADPLLQGVVQPVRHRLAEDGALDEDRNVLQYYEEMADAGDRQLQLVLGQLHMVGRGAVERDYPRAAALLRQAAARGDREAQAHLAFLYQHGLGVAQNRAVALRLYRDAAAGGSVAAMTGLGRLLLEGGDGVVPDYGQAAAYLRSAARQHSPVAQYYLALMLLDGLAGWGNPQEAATLLQLAAQQAHTGAMYKLALLYLSGTGVPVNIGAAAALLKRVAERGSVAQRLELAWQAYRAGRHREALWLYEWLAALGSAEAQTNAAFVLQHIAEQSGEPADRHRLQARALHDLRQAAAQDEVGAMVDVGDALYYGRGAPADAAAAVSWYRRAEVARHPQALFNLGWAHQSGDGAPRDLHRAKYYYDLAAAVSREALVPATLALWLLRLQVVAQPALAWLAGRGVTWDSVLLALCVGTLLVLLPLRQARRRAAARAAP